jgi:hypothetical protein
MHLVIKENPYEINAKKIRRISMSELPFSHSFSFSPENQQQSWEKALSKMQWSPTPHSTYNQLAVSPFYPTLPTNGSKTEAINVSAPWMPIVLSSEIQSLKEGEQNFLFYLD